MKLYHNAYKMLHSLDFCRINWNAILNFNGVHRNQVMNNQCEIHWTFGYEYKTNARMCVLKRPIKIVVHSILQKKLSLWSVFMWFLYRLEKKNQELKKRRPNFFCVSLIRINIFYNAHSLHIKSQKYTAGLDDNSAALSCWCHNIAIFIAALTICEVCQLYI